jgi:hypothetical protein
VDLLALSPAVPDGDTPAASESATPLDPGALIDLGDGVRIQIVDVRQTGQANPVTVVDLAILAGDLAVLVPGPGAPSNRWVEVWPDAVTIGRLPSSAVAWARVVPPRPWLLLVGEPSLERARGESGVPLLTRREYGQVELSVIDGAVAIQTERCPGGQTCQIDLPAPVLTSLLP